MYAVDDAIDVHCPQCANEESVYVEKIVQLVEDPGDAFLCRCGKCGWRFRVMEPAPEAFVEEAAPSVSQS
jgi:DNA-directed RNA polymerase subunit M/transcription elongation factor TFIIS